MLTFSYVIKHIIINKNKKLHNFYTLFTPYNKKSWKISVLCELYPNIISIIWEYSDKFEVYLLWIFTRSIVKTRIWIYVADLIFYLFIIKKKDKKLVSDKLLFSSATYVMLPHNSLSLILVLLVPWCCYTTIIFKYNVWQENGYYRSSKYTVHKLSI
jgi:hypothetical protein